MFHRIAHHLHGNVIAYLALFLALGAGGGYAVAATHTKTITVCADKKTGVLHLLHRGRCKRSQTRVSWNQQGPQGLQGATGPAGTPATKAWAVVSGAGTVAFGQGQGITAQHTGPGTYQLTVTAPACARTSSVPVVTVSDANPPNGQPAGAFPVAWVGDTAGNQEFRVTTGVVINGVFTATDHTFNVQDAC